MCLLALQLHRIWTIGLISTSYSSEVSPDNGSTENTVFPPGEAQVNVSITQTPLMQCNDMLCFAFFFFFNMHFSSFPSQLSFQHFLSCSSAASAFPFSPESSLSRILPVKWTTRSQCSPASTPPIFPVLSATTKYQRMRRARNRVRLRRFCPNIHQFLWQCATVQRTLTIWCT